MTSHHPTPDQHPLHHGDAPGRHRPGGGPRFMRRPFPGPFGEGEFGMPPGFGFGRGGGRRGGPRARRGDIRSAILGLLADTPTNGYGLIRAFAERTDGAWTPSPGSIYPTLAQLVDEGLIQQTGGSRGPYELTDAGREHVTAHTKDIDEAFASASGENGKGDEMMDSFRKLAMATTSFRGADAAQRTAAVAAIDAARRELHRILAQ